MSATPLQRARAFVKTKEAKVTTPTAAEIALAKSIFGQLGGRARSAKKTAAARRNASRPRPNRRKKEKPFAPEAA